MAESSVPVEWWISQNQTIYLREVREGQAKARGIPHEKKKQKRPTAVMATTIVVTQGGDAGRLRWLYFYHVSLFPLFRPDLAFYFY